MAGSIPSTSGTRRTRISAAHKTSDKPNNRNWRTRFLTALAETSNVSAAARTAQVMPSLAYKVKRAENSFATQWREALCEGYDLLEMEVLHRLRFGEPKDGDARFDNATALRLLSQHRETVAKERAIRNNADVEEVRASLHKRLLDMRDEVLASRKAASGE
jgi:hypothetical protein